MGTSKIVSSVKKQQELISEGLHQAVIADVVLVENVETSWGLQTQVRLQWLTDQLGTQPENKGKRLPVWSQYRASLHEKSKLRGVLFKILGYDPGPTFDVEQLVGTNAMLIVEHNENEGIVYSNVSLRGAGILKLAKGQTPISVPADFVRFEDRQNKQGGKKPGASSAAAPASSDAAEGM